MDLGIARRVVLLSAFAVAYLLLVLAGLSLREKSENLTIIWPAAGLLFMALFVAPRRVWIWLVATQVIVEITISAFHSSSRSASEYP